MPSRFSAGNSRQAFSGGLSPSAGKRTAGDPFVNPFISAHVPILWNALVGEFGRTVDYWLDNDPATSQSLVLIWKEGAEDEEVSPGRYSHALVRNSDLPRQPLLGDVVVKDSIEYDIVRVNAFAYGCCQVVLQDRSENF